MQDFKRLTVWQRAHQLALAAYAATQGFPKEETYGLVRQVRTAATSIPTNIAEGCGRSQGDLGRFLEIAMGSARELEYLLLLAQDLQLLSAHLYKKLNADTEEVKRMLFRFAQKVREDRQRSRADG